MNMSLRDNVYIKDLLNNEQATGYWKYVIDNCDYYIPNYGYMVLIDSNFKDLSQDDYTIKRKEDKLGTYKIYGEVASDFDSSQINNLNMINYDNLKEIINPKNFGKEFSNYGGITPPDEIMNLLISMNGDINGSDRVKNGSTNDLINKYMRKFVHNRVGGYLTDEESKYVLSEPNNDLKKGELCVYAEDSRAHKWALCINNLNEDSSITILTKHDILDKEIHEVSIDITRTRKYMKPLEVAQNYKSNEAKLAEEDLLEIYNVS